MSEPICNFKYNCQNKLRVIAELDGTDYTCCHECKHLKRRKNNFYPYQELSPVVSDHKVDNDTFFELIEDLIINHRPFYETVMFACSLTDGQPAIRETIRKIVDICYEFWSNQYAAYSNARLYDKKYNIVLHTGAFVGRIKIAWYFYAIRGIIPGERNFRNEVGIIDGEDAEYYDALVTVIPRIMDLMLTDCMEYNKMFYKWIEAGDV